MTWEEAAKILCCFDRGSSVCERWTPAQLWWEFGEFSAAAVARMLYETEHHRTEALIAVTANPERDILATQERERLFATACALDLLLGDRWRPGQKQLE